MTGDLYNRAVPLWSEQQDGFAEGLPVVLRRPASLSGVP